MSIINTYGSLVKFSHTIFAMPFAMVGLVMGIRLGGVSFSLILLFQVVLCMITARNTAMAFNRYLDRDIDAKNPRTASREIPSRKISPRSALWFTLVNAALFIIVAATINSLTFCLSPIALAIAMGYSYTKRFTALCHLVLGLALSVAPTAAYISVTGEFSMAPLLCSLMVLFWCGGFDIIYALQDREFDTSLKLHSIPAAVGTKNALIISTLMHVIAAALAVLIGILFFCNLIYFVGAAIFALLMVYQHSIVSPTNLTRINLAFGTTNGIASALYATFTIWAAFY